ncbi:hypothetical protein RW080711_073 [Synechococcus phage S-RIM8]|uniref:Uncharacterized protein n=2 Tax=Neptunevirus srim18 TaxID=2734121 RepID=A0A1D7SBT3_9CAUD|nr:hypothetical protein SXDG_00063 [Synechococcus phage S-RIM8 A.HR1]YP_009782982.1 hypothetical protein HOQ82_gp172 [Synechococcus phage S-RIM8]AFB15349.1 gp82 [Synechococcus phage S-RIM8 A.HR5]AFB17775.1 hypothetical protein SXEG_00193 [Synechococcus phage S-RIM8 A.HR3]AGH57761.1 hypothetical protein CPJG_00009 [Synechococcus phage KBS-M-1A]AFB17564.1 hypothetical protein SXDG_00063 [Synechococcus phage S-RIM8 A.HR1]AOO10882.1 hypothetical protein RW080711_073 [Synechococcus phage S-RIM8]
MTITTETLTQLKSNYARQLVEDMDYDTLEELAREYVEESMKGWSWDDVTEEICEVYGEDRLIELLPEGDNE